MKKGRKPFIFFVTLNLLSVLVILYSMYIYTSGFEGVPWHISHGWQFLGIIFFSVPAFLIIGFALLILGVYSHISVLNKVLPFVAMVALSLPAIIHVNSETFWIGTLIGAVMCFLTILNTVKNLKSERGKVSSSKT